MDSSASSLPKYYLSFSSKGQLALKLGLHRGLVDRLPERVLTSLRDLRSRFYALRYNEVLR